MPGKRVTQQQKRLYMTYRKDGFNQKAAAAKVGISERSGRKIEQDKVNEVPMTRPWRTRKDPFAGVWDSELLPFLEEFQELSPLTLLEYLQEQYPGRYPDKLLRTLQRRIKQWRAIHGDNGKEVMFSQQCMPGVQSLSDFTQLKDVTVFIAGEPLNHLLYHFRLRYSGWSHMKVILGGESFTALAEGLQEALWRLGGVPKEHRTDSLSAAYKNRNQQAEYDITAPYDQLCNHYNLSPTRNNLGKSHENGAIESPHGHIKRRIRQALIIRNSSDFKTLKEYELFIDKVVSQHNRRNAPSIDIERPYLQDLPETKTIDFIELSVKVSPSSTIRVKSNAYTVPSRLVGECLRVHLYHDRLDCFIGSSKVSSMNRVYGSKGHRNTNINYRHVYQALLKKPGAFRHWVYRDELLPTQAYRQIWQAADQTLNAQMACKYIVGCLALAAEHHCEKALADYILTYLSSGRLPSLSDIQERFRVRTRPIPEVDVQQHDLSSYDELGGEPCTA